MSVTGWATAPSAHDGVWHAFATDMDSPESISACGEVILPAASAEDLEQVPRGRPCLVCLMSVTEDLPPVGRMGSAS